jgi:hypothetical protein
MLALVHLFSLFETPSTILPLSQKNCPEKKKKKGDNIRPTSSESEKLSHSCTKVQMMCSVKTSMQIDQMTHNKHDGDNEIHS